MSSQDVIIIGGGLTGLTTAYVCQQYGYKPLILEKSNLLGGGNKSLDSTSGEIFDSGYHTLDSGRSEITTNFFKKILNHEFREFELRRGLVIKNSLLAYNSDLQFWPSELKGLFPKTNLLDDISSLESLDQIRNVYGKSFVELIAHDILPSYPSKKWALENGGNIIDHFDYVYPWFFPKAKKKAKRENEWDQFHDKKRDEKHLVLYPSQGGFDTFIKKLQANIERLPHNIKTGVTDLSFDLNDGSGKISSLSFDGSHQQAAHIFWCAPITQLFRMFNLPFKIEGKPQRILLGNFILREALSESFHEILVGSSNHLINRISFPGLIAGRKNNLVQVEFYFPDGDYKNENWKDSWKQSLKDLGILSPGNQVVHFETHSELRGFATKDNFEKVSAALKQQLSDVSRKLNLPFPMIGPENINRLIPETIYNVTKVLTAKG
jgi:protoporphyrinogen oxidase